MVEIVDVQTYHDQLRAQLTSLWTRIQGLDQNYSVRRDLIALHTNIRVIWAKLDNEMIECRKRSRATANYRATAKEIETCIKIMEKEIFWQKLH
jgi:hypothetical protein